NQPPENKMIVTVSQPELEYTGNFGWINDDGGGGWDLSEDTLRMSTVRFNIVASKDSAYYVTIKKYSYGRTEEEALRRSEKIRYTAYSKDSLLDLANGYTVDKDSKFRFQQVEIEILVPIGKKIRFDESVSRKLNPTSFRIKRSYRNKRIVGISISDDNIYMNRFRTDVDYIMGIDGSLKDAEGKAIVNDDYRYKENDSIELKRSIEQKKRELKELEERQKIQKPSTFKKVRMDNKDDEVVAGAPSPIISLLGMFN
ncbi:MAG: hypothetical protein JJE22_14605, partial [Bacteroidia bacterium]|nr:hypothetical protein [Bacteroidia bacterium]